MSLEERFWMKLIIPSCPSIQEVTRCTMICATCIGGQIWSRISPNMSWNAILVEELRWTTCVYLDFYSPCPFLFGNRRIFPWISLRVYPAPPRALIPSGSLWTASPSQPIFFRWILGTLPESMRRYTLIRLWPYMEFLLLSSLIEGQFLSLVSGRNSRNVWVLISSEARHTTHKLMVKLKG